MTGIEIFNYTDLYKEQVADLIVHIQQKEFNVPIDLEAQPDLKEISKFYQGGNGNFWVAVHNNLVIGTIALLDIGNMQGALRKMFVHAGYRGKPFKAGQLLLNELLQWARQQKFNEIFLGTTEKFIAAQRFYEKNGFTEIKKERLPGSFPVMRVDVKFYRYDLTIEHPDIHLN
ncbi:MAG: GNAT family N-acetyltransferase [Bacteroidota bacterium]|nr:GNAT family N-acetyltransferase [Bacteroidota bacterium]